MAKLKLCGQLGVCSFPAIIYSILFLTYSNQSKALNLS